MKVLIISPCDLPVPAVKGGAVGTLIESLVIQNEKEGLLDLTVVSIEDKDAVKKAQLYPNTKFLFIKKTALWKWLDSFTDFLLQKMKQTSETKNYFWKIQVIFQLASILQKGDYDRVVVQNSGYLLNAFRLKKLEKRYKGRIFYHLHNDIPDKINHRMVKKTRMLLISQYLRKKLVATYGESIVEQTDILPNGINCQQFRQQLSPAEKKQLKKELGISESKKVVLFAGRIVPYKGIGELMEAFQILGNKEAILLVVGSFNFGSEETSPFTKKIAALSDELNDSVRTTGYVPYKDMWKYYQLADIAALPSMWEEPAGLTIIEAMSAGLPVISTVSGGIPEFLDERFGILLDRNPLIVENLALSINQMLGNLDKWQAKGQTASVYINAIASEERFYQNFLELVSKEAVMDKEVSPELVIKE